MRIRRNESWCRKVKEQKARGCGVAQHTRSWKPDFEMMLCFAVTFVTGMAAFVAVRRHVLF